MKSYNHIFEKFISNENIYLAIKNFSKGKRNRKDVKEIFENPDKYIDKIRSYAICFKGKKHKPIEIYDGISRKKRIIIVPTVYEQIIHHMVINVMKPIIMRGMYEHSYGSIPGRGGHKGKEIIQKWIKHDKKNIKYCLKMDIRKYFDSIPHDVLKEKLGNIIHDERFLNVLYKIIETTEKGLPLGFYTSQWLANWYLQGLDHYIKENLGATHYIRYMDDMVIFGSNKRKLHKDLECINQYLGSLGLELNEKTQIFRFACIKNGKEIGRDLDFMGFRFFRNRVILRKGIMLKMTRKAKKIGKKKKPTTYDIRQMMSYIGWLNATDTYDVYLKYIKPYVDFGKFKKRISRYDKRIHSEAVII